MKVSLGSHKNLNSDLDQLELTYTMLGVEVVRFNSDTEDAVFHRDVSAWTPFGHIKCNMGKQSRGWEPSAWFNQTGITPSMIVRRPGTFEGADLLWLDNYKTAIIGVGARTNHDGASAVSEWLTSNSVRACTVSLPTTHDQHLLGVVNTDGKSVFSCSKFLCAQMETIFGIEVCYIPPQDYPIKGPNWVDAGGALIVNKRCVETNKVLRQVQRKSVIGVSIEQLLQFGGGVGCATGVISM